MFTLRKICLSLIFLLTTASIVAGTDLTTLLHRQFLFTYSFFSDDNPSPTTLLETIYGIDATPAAVIAETVDHKTMQRLKHIDQAGPTRYHTDVAPYSRYTHSLGVYYLLKRFGASDQEQLAGLLHDASHTAFSHLADHIFYGGEKGGTSFQDDIHTWHLTQMGLGEIMDKHDIAIKDIDPHNGSFPFLEADYPDVCADRLDSNLQTGFQNGILTKNDIEFILTNLRHENGQWYFVSPEAARKLAETSLHLTENYWASATNMAIYEWYAEAIRYAMDKGLLTKDQLIFGNDLDVMAILHKSDDPYIQQRLKWASNPDKHFRIVHDSKSTFDKAYTPKFRGMDPLVKLADGSFTRLSSVDNDYKSKYQGLREKMKSGLRIKFVV